MSRITVRIGHLYPDYLNIYADRGNMAVFERRAAARGLELEVSAIGIGDPVKAGAHDLYYCLLYTSDAADDSRV